MGPGSEGLSDEQKLRDTGVHGVASGHDYNDTKYPIFAHDLRIKDTFGAKLGSRSSTRLQSLGYTALKIKTKIRADALVRQHRRQVVGPPVAVEDHDSTHHDALVRQHRKKNSPPVSVKVHDTTHYDGHSQTSLSSKKPPKLNVTHKRYYGPRAYYYDNSGKSKCSEVLKKRSL